MAEFFEAGEQPEAEASPAVQTDGTAVAIALDRARRRKGRAAGTDEIDRFLEKQEGLIDDQRAHLREQMHHMRLKHVSERLKVATQFLTIGVGLAVAVGIGALFWSASRADGVVVEAFSAPPDLEAKGLTGKVLAGQLQDKLNELQAETRASRAASTYANDWGHEIKVEIPETGVSIGELQRYLRGWLGRETHIAGDLFKTPEGLKLTVRADGVAGDAVTGQEDKLDDLVTAGALALYKKTQPYRWAAWMDDHGHQAEAEVSAREIAATASPTERAWAFNMLRTWANSHAEAISLQRQGIALDPNVAHLWRGLAQEENFFGHWVAQSEANQSALRAMRRPDQGGYSGAPYVSNFHGALAAEARKIGDHASALEEIELAIKGAPLERAGAVGVAKANRVVALGGLHRISDARAMLTAYGDDAGQSRAMLADHYVEGLSIANAQTAIAAGDWDEAYRQASGLEAMVQALPADFKRRQRYVELLPTMVWLHQAEALAHMGRMQEAQALAARMPSDCYPCIRARARIAAFAGQNAEADRWFAEAERQAPGFVAASTEWGEAMLRRGDLDRAIAKLKQAHRIGPKFADPLAYWGEALLAKGDAKAATAKFAEADKFAPKWGRLHLKWAQALAKLGKADDARAQLKAAAGLDLTPAERAELTALKL